MPAEVPSSESARTPLPLVRLAAVPDEPGDQATARVQLKIGDQPVPLEITVPAGMAQPRELLPIFQGFTNVVVGVAVRHIEEKGLHISCRAGCGACCRQPVPISETEARALARLVERMPEPRQSQLRARFAAAVQRLDDAGLLDQFRQLERPGRDQILSLGLNYFHMGLACPFLEDESCSIHPDRPLSCREYLVTTPAEACSRPTAATVRTVPMPAHLARALRAMDKEMTTDGLGWVPLVLSLEWAETHPEAPPSRTGASLVQEFFTRLAQRPDHADEIGRVALWVLVDNLRPLATTLSWITGADFADADWVTLSRGVQESDAAADQWYEHTFTGKLTLSLQLARDTAAGVIRLRVETPPETEAQVQLALTIFQRFRLCEDEVQARV